MHSRMRHRVSEFQKVLNRAKPEVQPSGERKTVTWVVVVAAASGRVPVEARLGLIRGGDDTAGGRSGRARDGDGIGPGCGGIALYMRIDVVRIGGIRLEPHGSCSHSRQGASP